MNDIDIEAHFENIPSHIIRHLKTAKVDVVVAVAWFTDIKLFDALLGVVSNGVRVRLAVLDDGINNRSGGIDFGQIEEIGKNSQVFLIPSGGRNAIMHHKFCVVDGNTLITGSFNWTRRAQKNDENITVIANNPSLCRDYITVFERMLAKYHITEKPPIDTTEVKRRLEAVKSLLPLQDWDTTESQLSKLKPVSEEYGLVPLYELVAARDDQRAIEYIVQFLERVGSIVIAEDMDIAFLKLELQTLETQIIFLESENVEMERIILNFNSQQDYALGDLLTEYFRLKSIKLRLTAKDEYSESVADNAQKDYERYKEGHEQAQESPPAPTLSEPETDNLKLLYREACQRCHPDKVDEDYKAEAQGIFAQLQDAYRNNDIAAVRTIHAAVKSGNLNADDTSQLSESEALGHRAIVLRNEAANLFISFSSLKNSEYLKKALAIDDWDSYFVDEKLNLRTAILELNEELALLQDE